MQLVLSLFPGIGLLDMAFEQEGFCVVRGPDVLWGGDVRRFHPPAGKFDGVIGGPPCQPFSMLRTLLKAKGSDTKAVDLIPEFVRCIEQARPRWFVMENVKNATVPMPEGYLVYDQDIRDAHCGGDTQRKRRIWFGTLRGVHGDLKIRVVPRNNLLPLERAVTRNARLPSTEDHRKRKGRGGILPGNGRYMPLADVVELCGLPRTFHKSSQFKTESLRLMLGNGVPLPMGRAIARAVRDATQPQPQEPTNDQPE